MVRKFWWGRVFACVVLSAGMADAKPPEPPDEDIAADVARLAQDLGVPEYDLRQRATAKLTALGEKAIPELERVVREAKSLEVRDRARGVLKKLYGAEFSLEALIGLAQRAAASDAERQQIEPQLRQLVQLVRLGTGRSDWKLPVRVPELKISGDRTGEATTLIMVDRLDIPFLSRAVVLAKETARVIHAHDCIIISGVAADITHLKRSVVLAGIDVQIIHSHNSIAMSGWALRSASVPRSSVFAAANELSVSGLNETATIVNRPAHLEVPRRPTHRKEDKYRYVSISPLALHDPEYQKEIERIPVAGHFSASGDPPVRFWFIGRPDEYTARYQEEARDARGNAVPKLKGRKLVYVREGLAVLSDDKHYTLLTK